MKKRGDPKVLSLVVRYLRATTGLDQGPFGKAARVDQASVSRYERAEAPVPEESLHRMAEAAAVPWPVVINLRRFYAAALSLAERARRRLALADTAPIEQAILESVLLAVTPYLVEQWTERPSLDRALREAAESWEALKKLPPERRRRLIELNPSPEGNAALARTICEASARAAAADVAKAKELADLAVYVAERLPEEADRARTAGYGWCYVANALRVATEFDEADEATQRSCALWQAGEPARWLPLAEWRLLDREASLHRERQRFTKALDCIERAFALCGGDPAAAGRILVNKERVLHQIGDFEGALAALAQAAPFVEAVAEPNLLFALRFNRVANLCALERFAAAAALLPEVREMAIEQGRKLHLIRLLWLSAKIAAGTRRLEEAEAGLEQVRQEFTDLGLPYEVALSSLDLAVLSLKEGRLDEVKDLAVAMNKIFEAKGIAREALAALTLFCEAAKQETATVALVRQVIAEVERVQ